MNAHSVTIQFDGAWVWQELLDTIDDVCQKSSLSHHAGCQFIFDLSENHIFPRDVLFKMRRQQLQLPDTVSRVILVGEGQFAQCFWQFLQRATIPNPIDVVQVPTLADIPDRVL